MNRPEVMLLLAVVSERWPNWPMPTSDDRMRARVMAWEDVVSDLALAECRAALAAMGARDFAPDPGHIRATVLELRGTGAPDLDAAMREIFDAISAHGWTEVPEFSHPAIGAAVRAVGGWLEVCRSDNPEALRAHLGKMYGSASTRMDQQEALPPAVAAILGSIGRPMPALEEGATG